MVRRARIDWARPLDGAIPHPQVAVQENVLNHSRVESVVVCANLESKTRSSPRQCAARGEQSELSEAKRGRSLEGIQRG